MNEVVQAVDKVEAELHDTGYRRYHGKLEGRGAAARALFVDGVRAMFGMGRKARYKAIPVFVIVATLVPALGILMVAGASSNLVPVKYSSLIATQTILYVIFAASQTPELFTRDQQYRVLPILLTRQISSVSYVLARTASVFCSVALVVVLPPLLLYIGEYGNATDPSATYERMGMKILPVLLHSAITSIVIAAISSLIAIINTRRIYATAAIIGVFLAVSAISSGIKDMTVGGSHVADLVDPLRTLAIQARFLFNEQSSADLLRGTLSVELYVGWLVLLSAVCMLLMLLRVRKMSL